MAQISQGIVDAIDQVNKYGRTALHASFDRCDMAKKLLEKGANPNILTQDKISTVGIAIKHFHSKTIENY